jgi:hypothetical protein
MSKKDDKPTAFKKAYRPKGKGQGVGGGRPEKISQEKIDLICSYLKNGEYVETAIALADVPKPTFYLWCKMGHEKPKSLYAKLIDAVQRAQAEAERKDLLYISKAASKQWQAAAWRLARRNPNRWADTQSRVIANENETKPSNEFKLAYDLSDDEETE